VELEVLEVVVMAEQILMEVLQLLTQEAVVVEQVIRLHQVTAAPALLS
jgi:hypothetical protein